MNSRDAAYEEEQFKAVLEASRQEVLGLTDGDIKGVMMEEEEDEEGEEEEEEEDGDEGNEDLDIDKAVAIGEKAMSRKGKRKAEDGGESPCSLITPANSN